jgi:hypothetical protein
MGIENAYGASHGQAACNPVLHREENVIAKRFNNSSPEVTYLERLQFKPALWNTTEIK